MKNNLELMISKKVADRSHFVSNIESLLYPESQYIYSQLQLQYCPSWESNIERVDPPYCSVSWGYIFQYTPSRAGPIRENISQLIEQYWRVKFQYYRMYRTFKHKLYHALGVIHTQKPPDRDDGQTI